MLPCARGGRGDAGDGDGGSAPVPTDPVAVRADAHQSPRLRGVSLLLYLSWSMPPAAFLSSAFICLQPSRVLAPYRPAPIPPVPALPRRGAVVEGFIATLLPRTARRPRLSWRRPCYAAAHARMFPDYRRLCSGFLCIRARRSHTRTHAILRRTVDAGYPPNRRLPVAHTRVLGRLGCGRRRRRTDGRERDAREFHILLHTAATRARTRFVPASASLGSESPSAGPSLQVMILLRRCRMDVLPLRLLRARTVVYS
ncbi:hypothetical protein C8R47DRAFT_290123 [Mycena vitilis]|nr:hypothetical protein C8R47DRAFT_290123 [Mycena vitilis]